MRFGCRFRCGKIKARGGEEEGGLEGDNYSQKPKGECEFCQSLIRDCNEGNHGGNSAFNMQEH